jgi:hypothetical protein
MKLFAFAEINSTFLAAHELVAIKQHTTKSRIIEENILLLPPHFFLFIVNSS